MAFGLLPKRDFRDVLEKICIDSMCIGGDNSSPKFSGCITGAFVLCVSWDGSHGREKVFDFGCYCVFLFIGALYGLGWLSGHGIYHLESLLLDIYSQNSYQTSSF